MEKMKKWTENTASATDTIGWFDTLRGIACLIVFWAHLGVISGTNGVYYNGCGKVGVWLFMILSGFCFMYPLTGQGRYINVQVIILFYIKKAVRLLPLYFLSLILAWNMGFLTDFWSVIKHIFLLQGSGHFWYMPVIIKFFMIAPVFWLFRNMIKQDSKLLMLLLAIGIVFALIFPFTHYLENSLQMRWYLPVFIMGFLLAIRYHRIESQSRKWIWADGLTVIFVLLIFLCTPWFREKLWKIEPSSWLQNKYMVVGGLWSAIIIAIANGKFLKKLLEKLHFVQWIGDISFPLYLIHYPIMYKINQFEITWWKKVVSIVIFSGMIAWILHHFVEKPLNEFVSKVERKKIFVGKK